MKRFFSELRRLFIVGIFTATPLALTIWILYQLFVFADETFRPFVSIYFHRPIPGLGVVIGIFFILVVGFLAPSVLGKQFLVLMERLVQRVPLAKLIYTGSKQIFDSFSRSHDERFSKVVLLPFLGDKTHAIGFVTQEVEEGWFYQKDLKLAVFVPTAPNPTSGYMVFVAGTDVIPLDISVENALKLVISGGLVKWESVRLLGASQSIK